MCTCLCVGMRPSKDRHSGVSLVRLCDSILYLVCGRSSEVAWMTWEAMSWCFSFLCVFSSLPQAKVSEVKQTCFVSWTCRHDDWYLMLADYLTLNPQRHGSYDPDSDSWWFDGPAWVFPDLQSVKYPGTTVGGYIKALQPTARGGQARYASVAVDILPLNPSGGVHARAPVQLWLCVAP